MIAADPGIPGICWAGVLGENSCTPVLVCLLKYIILRARTITFVLIKEIFFANIGLLKK